MSAPNLKEIEWAIAELKQEESSFDVYAKLADLYTVREQMTGDAVPEPQAMAYSTAAAPVAMTLDQYGDSEFLQAVANVDPVVAWGVMDELMDTLRFTNERAYDTVMRKLSKV